MLDALFCAGKVFPPVSAEAAYALERLAAASGEVSETASEIPRIVLVEPINIAIARQEITSFFNIKTPFLSMQFFLYAVLKLCFASVVSFGITAFFD